MLVKSVRVTDEPRLSGLSELAQPVEQLFYFGDLLHLLDKPLVAIVGSRKVSDYGRAVTIKLATDLARAGVVIVSGLALGIDSIAHQAALDAGGQVIAVLPSGLDRIYPAQHLGLARRIVQEGGALITEHAVGKGPPMKYRFIARNRIIAAISRGVLIPEAALKSGSLHTANFALEAGIEVFAVPGNITSNTSEGTNNLIKSGAQPVTRAEDILEVLGIQTTTEPCYQPQDPAQAAIMRTLQDAGGEAARILELSGLTPAEFQQTLTILEVNGAIRQTGSGTWTRS